MRLLLGFWLYVFLTAFPLFSIADPWEEFTGILTDPMKIDSASERSLQAIEIMAIHAERLLEKGSGIAAEHLDTINSTIIATRNWASSERAALINGVGVSFDRLENIQENFFSSTRSVVKCSTAITGHEFRKTVADSLNDLGASRPRFTVFGLKIGEVKINATHIPSPIEGFRRARDLYDRRISEVDQNTSPVVLVDAYAEIQRLADRARCHYKEDSRVHDELYKVELIYARKARAWKWLNRGV